MALRCDIIPFNWSSSAAKRLIADIAILALMNYRRHRWLNVATLQLDPQNCGPYREPSGLV